MKEILHKIENYCIEDLMGDSFGAYAKYIIQDRAIPDVRDGLKPVQRRIMYAMYKNRNTYEKPYLKAAATVGDVIGKYHPHGDTSVYDALARMSQDWKQRYLLVDFKGNNGSIDGDSPAAYRYTETRLSKLANEILKDLDKNTVLMAPTFDDARLEPTVLPARFPNLLVNGTTGISAGYATNIPPHNLGEIIDAVIKRIDNPNCRLETLMEIVKGPDFPTGGTVFGKSGIRSAFETGRGKVVVRSKYEVIKNKGKEQIVITEIPYDVNKQVLVSKIADIKIDKKIDGIAEVSDLSDIDGLKIVIDLKAGVDSQIIINYLLKNTDLQASYNYNMVTIVNRRPKLLGLLGIIDAYIAHQKEVVTNRSKFDLAAKERELHVLEGLIKALDILDEVIKAIRASKNKSDAKINIEKMFGFTEVQAEYIVMLQLYKLTNTDVAEVIDRCEQLRKEIAVLKSILESEEVLLKVIKHELKSIKKDFELPRMTSLEDEIEDIKIDVTSMIARENVVVVVTNEGYIKRVSTKSYASSREEETTLKPGDYVKGWYELTTLDNVLVFTNLGNYLYIPVHVIPEAKWKELGKHVSNVISLAADEVVIGSLVLSESNKREEIILASKNGLIKRSVLEDFIVSRYSKPMTAMKLKEDDSLISVGIATKEVLMISAGGNYLRYLSEEIPLVGVKASGVKGMNLKDDYLTNAMCIDKNHEYLNIITNNKTAKRVKIVDLAQISRAKKGNQILKRVKTNAYLVQNAYLTCARDEIGIKSDSEIKVLKNSEIAIMDTASTGSTLSKYPIDDCFVVSELVTYLSKKETIQKEEVIQDDNRNVEIEELTIDNFLDDFKI